MVGLKSKQIPEKTFFILSTGLLIVLFFISTSIHYRDRNNSTDEVNYEQLIQYASLFLEGKPRDRAGRLMDCSGYTRNV